MRLMFKLPIEKLSGILGHELSKFTIVLYAVAITKNWGIAIIHRVPKEENA